MANPLEPVSVPRRKLNAHGKLGYEVVFDVSGWSVNFRCWNGHVGVLGEHEIRDNGTVSPSVMCPREGCDFHAYITLENWSPDA